MKELWLVDETEQTVELRTLQGARYDEGRVFEKEDAIESSVITGLTIEVKKIFED